MGGTEYGRADGFDLDLLKAKGTGNMDAYKANKALRRFTLGMYLDTCRKSAAALLKDLQPALRNMRIYMRSYISIGVPTLAWSGYRLFKLCFHPFIAIFTPLAVRFYSFVGYMESLRMTLGERLLSVYLCGVAVKVSSKVLFARLLLR